MRGSYHPPKSAVPPPKFKPNRAKRLLQEVLDYRHGKGQYNFSHLPEYSRETAAFDAWIKVESKIKDFLEGKND